MFGDALPLMPPFILRATVPFVHPSKGYAKVSVGGNPPRCVQTHEETALLPPSTESDKILRKLVRAFLMFPRTRARGIPSRHSREGGNPHARPRSVSFLSA